MDLNEDDVIQIIRYLNESNFSELQLQMGDLRIVVNRAGSPVPLPDIEQPSSRLPAPSDPAPPPAPAQGVEEPALAPPLPVAQPVTAAQEQADPGLRISITSPMLGTFYRAPAPGEPPFVDVGSVVDEETTVCIIEVMKLFTTIKAERRGRVSRISVDDGQLVEYGQMLFLLEPERD